MNTNTATDIKKVNWTYNKKVLKAFKSLFNLLTPA